MSQSEDIDAIHDYFKRTAPQAATKSLAQQIASQWFNWYNGLGWYSKNFESDTYNEARSRRDSYNQALGAPNLKAMGYSELTTEQLSKTDTEFTRMPAVTTYTEPVKQPGQVHATISLGSKGPDVVAWQKIIKVSPADGKFGPMTDKATRIWQQQHGITPDGIVGPLTWSAATGEKVITPAQDMVNKMGPTPVVTVPKTEIKPKPVTPTVPTKPPILQAGIMSGITNLPAPAKIGLGALALGTAVYYGTKKK